jgi:lantibiotic transport system permease protein
MFRYIKAELIKTKNSFTYLLIIIAAVFMPVATLYIFTSKWKLFVPANGQNPWIRFSEISWNPLGLLFIIFFVVLLICLLFNIEHKNNTWKHLFSLPVSKSTLYFIKLLTLFILVICFYVIFCFSLILSGYFAGVIQPKLQFTSHIPGYKTLLETCQHSFISSLGIIGIHFWLSIQFKNMIIPISFVVVCFVCLLLLLEGNADEIRYFPYAYNYFSVKTPFVKLRQIGFLREHEIYSIIYFIIFTGFSYMDFTKKFNAK